MLMTTLVPFYREYDLPWEVDPEASARFRKILRVLLIVFLIFGILFPLLPTPKRTATETDSTAFAVEHLTLLMAPG